MKTEEIMMLIKAMEEHDLTSFELCEGNLRLTLKRGHDPVIVQAPSVMQAVPEAVIKPSEPAAPVSKGNAPAAETQPEKVEKPAGRTVNSPLVGTFYAAASPEAEPYVKPGDKVKKGQVLGIIEAMKLMNEIESEFEGTVEEILVSNEEVVEYGQPLFRII